MSSFFTIPVYFLLSLLSRRRRQSVAQFEAELRRLWRELDAERQQTREEQTLLEQRVWRRMGEMQRMAETNARQIETLANGRK